MMHRRLTTAGNEVAPHYHQLLVRGVKRAEPGRAEPSEKYQYTAPAAASLREQQNRPEYSRHKQKKYRIMLQFILHLDEASDKSIQQHAAEQQQNKAEVQNMSIIPTLTNIDRAEPRNPENMRYTAAAEAVYPAGRP